MRGLFFILLVGFLAVGNIVRSATAQEMSYDQRVAEFRRTVLMERWPARLGSNLPPLVSSFSLVDGVTGKPLEGFNPLTPGARINLAKVPSGTVAVRANVGGRGVGSVLFLVNDAPDTKLISSEPYQIGPVVPKYVSGTLLGLGAHTITAVPFSEINGKGKPGISSTTTVVFGSVGIPGSIAPEPRAPSPTVIPGPNELIPGLAQWRSRMLEYGRLYCDEDQINELGLWEGSVWYYDGARVYYQIADYRGDSSWHSCAEYVVQIYRESVIAAGGAVGGWRVFPIGLLRHYQQSGDELSRQAVILLATKSAFAESAGGADADLSRETAYIIDAYLAAEELGYPQSAKLERAVDYALGHIAQWTSSATGVAAQPFMIGLTVEALLRYHEKHPDNRIPAAVKVAADWVWVKKWDAAKRYFVHADANADLNLLIAPMYAWLYKESGDPIYRKRGDAVFKAGVELAWLGSGKQFSQNYRSSFNYVHWRLSAE